MEWKQIEGYTEHFVSNTGLIRNKRGMILKHYMNNKGYCSVKFSCDKKHHLISRLVALAFIPNPDNKPEIDHINNQKSDNSVENLRWATRSENMINRPKKEGCASKFKGVYWNGKLQKWYAKYTNIRQVHLGVYDTEEEANDAYLNYRKSLEVLIFKV